MDENITQLNDMRRVKNMEKAIKTFETQLADLKKAYKVLEPHREFMFFSVTCHALIIEQRTTATELLKLRVRLDRAKALLK